jgi:hypothetical protein
MTAWYTKHMYLAFYWLAMSNSCVNPIVYYWMNKRSVGKSSLVPCPVGIEHGLPLEETTPPNNLLTVPTHSPKHFPKVFPSFYKHVK